MEILLISALLTFISGIVSYWMVKIILFYWNNPRIYCQMRTPHFQNKERKSSDYFISPDVMYIRINLNDIVYSGIMNIPPESIIYGENQGTPIKQRESHYIFSTKSGIDINYLMPAKTNWEKQPKRVKSMISNKKK